MDENIQACIERVPGRGARVSSDDDDEQWKGSDANDESSDEVEASDDENEVESSDDENEVESSDDENDDENDDEHIAENTEGGDIALYKSLAWDNGATLRVLFIGGSAKVQSKIKHYANIWSNYANISFTFVSSGPAEIRISFEKGGSWSYIGKTALSIPADRPTMNFGWFNDNTPDKEFSRITLHEFGHAIGCVHEHQQPNQKIIWNKDYVYKYHEEQDGWSKERVDKNIFNKYSSDDVSSTAWDATSIMEYPIPAEFTLNGYHAGYNTTLSRTDIEFISNEYPFPIDGLKTGTFSTVSIRDWRNPTLDNRSTIKFSQTYPRPPTVLLGLTRLDFKHGANIRIKALVEHVSNRDMTINLKSWSNSVQHSSAVSYLLIHPDNKEFQSGQFSTKDDHVWTSPQPKTSRRIYFERPYDVPPKVVVFLSSLDIDHAANCRVRTFATDITTDSFIIHIDSWADTRLWSAVSVWIAYPSGKKKIASGSVNIKDIRPSNEPESQNSSDVSFEGAEFYNRPNVFLALNSLDENHKKNTRIALSATDVSADGMTWHIDSWSNSILYSAGLSYIAFK